jgi:hypothetical protein
MGKQVLRKQTVWTGHMGKQGSLQKAPDRMQKNPGNIYARLQVPGWKSSQLLHIYQRFILFLQRYSIVIVHISLFS